MEVFGPMSIEENLRIKAFGCVVVFVNDWFALTHHASNHRGCRSDRCVESAISLDIVFELVLYEISSFFFVLDRYWCD